MIIAVGISYLLLLDAILFWMFHDIKPGRFFTKRVFKGLKLISLFLAILIFKSIAQLYLYNYLLKEITHGQFQAVFRQSPILPYLLASFILQGQKIEQEQELTV